MKIFSCFFLLVVISGNDIKIPSLPIVQLLLNEPFPNATCLSTSLPFPSCLKRKISMSFSFKDRNSWTSSGQAAYHGDSSLQFAKHSMSVTLKDPMPGWKGHKYILHGPWIDGSLMRNHMAQWLFRNTGRYAMQTQHVLLQVQLGKNIGYHGIYLLMEDITAENLQVADNTADCTKEELNGGWVWQYNPLSYGDIVPNFVRFLYPLRKKRILFTI